MTTQLTERAHTDEQDVPEGKLFEVPRVAVVIDDTDPTVLKLAFSGSIDLERGQSRDVDLYNSLKAGKPFTLQVEGHVGTTKTTHRRDSEGDVDAVVQTKSLIIHSLDAE